MIRGCQRQSQWQRCVWEPRDVRNNPNESACYRGRWGEELYELLKVINFGHGHAGAGILARHNRGVLAGR